MRQQDKIGVPSLGARTAQPELIGGNGLVRILGPAFHQFGAAIVNADETKNGVAFENKRITRADANRFGGLPCFPEHLIAGLAAPAPSPNSSVACCRVTKRLVVPRIMVCPLPARKLFEGTPYALATTAETSSGTAGGRGSQGALRSMGCSRR